MAIVQILLVDEDDSDPGAEKRMLTVSACMQVGNSRATPLLAFIVPARVSTLEACKRILHLLVRTDAIAKDHLSIMMTTARVAAPYAAAVVGSYRATSEAVVRWVELEDLTASWRLTPDVYLAADD